MSRISLFFLLATMLFAIACHKKNAHDCPTDVYTYTFKNSSRVDTVSGPVWATHGILMANVVPGNRRVFTYRLDHTTCPEIQDGDFTRTLVFEADPQVTHFEYNTDSLGAAKCYLQTSCYGCGGAIVPAGGTITGTQTSASRWAINADLKFGTTTVLQFSASFTPGQ